LLFSLVPRRRYQPNSNERLLYTVKMATSSEIEKYLLAQFEAPVAQEELEAINVSGFDWVERTRRTIKEVSKLLPSIAVKLKCDLEAEFNSGSLLKQEYKKGEVLVMEVQESSPALKNWYDATGKVVASVRESSGIDSQQVSAAVQAVLLSQDGFGRYFRANGNSIYPDLLLVDSDYEGLPRQCRTNPVDGPCLRGDKPSNVPDGVEIKTNRGTRIKVDAHGAHAGLHLGVTWKNSDDVFKVTGIWIAFIRKADHRESGRNVAVTTVKYSFGHSLFMSLLEPSFV
jgi:hypothetical protein